jgi:beta-xylosidase
MIEAVMLWNEPNNLSHWDFELDRDWEIFARLVVSASAAVHAESPSVLRVLGGLSPIDPAFIAALAQRDVLSHVDVIALHGFPLDWNHWMLDEWPSKIGQIRAATSLPIWITEVGVSTFGAEEVQEFGLKRTFTLLRDVVPRVHWYSLFDLPKAWPATTRHREAEGSSYYRHFYMGLLKEDGSPKRAARVFHECTPDFGICQWIHFEDPRLDDITAWLGRLGVRHVRTGLSWADWLRPGAEKWFDRQMRALDAFDVTVTFCFTPESRGLKPHHTSPPRDVLEYADFCGRMVRRYAA